MRKLWGIGLVVGLVLVWLINGPEQSSTTAANTESPPPVLTALLIDQFSPSVHPFSSVAPSVHPLPSVDSVLISALYYDGYYRNDLDEAFELINVSDAPVDITRWQAADSQAAAVFPTRLLAPGERIWCARQAVAFAEEFGFPPDFEFGSDSDPAVPDMGGKTPRFANSGDVLTLRDATGTVVDVAVYKIADPLVEGWTGEAIQPYRSSNFGEEGQILYRKLDATGQSLPDTGTAADWAQDPTDPVDGRKVRYPGWDLERFRPTVQSVASVTVKVLLAPDNVYEGLRAEIDAAEESIAIEGYTIKSAALAEAVVARLQAGVAVKMLLEGAPAFEGIEDQERWVAQQIEAAGGQVYFMISDSAANIHDRYAYQHAKFMLIDGQTLIVGSENLNPTGMPDDDKSDGTFGRRGAYLVITGAPALVARAQAVFDADLDPVHKDILRWTATHPRYGAPPNDFVPDLTSGGSFYPIRAPQPLTVTEKMAIEMIQAPENALESLLSLIGRAGPGDSILVEQLYERTFWGSRDSGPGRDPNPRLEAYLDAARRGASVRVVLDRFFDDPEDPRSNAATREYVNGLAATEGLDIEVRLGNPAGEGLHNKMVLAMIGGQGTVHVGSINGSESSHKVNRELALQVQSDEVYAYLADVFVWDWVMSKGRLFLPLVVKNRWW